MGCIRVLAGVCLATAAQETGAASKVVVWGYNPVPSDLTNAVQIAAGGYHSVALRADGTVVSWGYNDVGQTNVPQDLMDVAAIAAGGCHSLALRTNGTVVGWGRNNAGQTAVPALTNAVAIAAGGAHSLALRSDGTVVAWGDNTYGQTNVPAGLSNVVAISAGTNHCVILRADGTLAAWGIGSRGETNVWSSPTNVAVAISAGFSHNLKLRQDGTVATWGWNYDGLPNVPKAATNVQSIAAGYVSSMALRADGTVVTWGEVPQPRPGIWITNSFLGLTDVVAVAGGTSHNLALVGDGPPFLTLPGLNLTVENGGRFQARVQATGARPFGYQWQLNGTDLVGATNPVLLLEGVGRSQSGSYSVTVSNALGVVTRGGVSLTVVAPILINAQPQDQVTFLGGNAQFSITATSAAPIRFQWQFNGADLDGATNATLLLTNAQPSQAGIYCAKTDNGYGSLTSSNASLSLGPVVAWGSQGPALNVPAGLSNVAAITAGGYHSLALKSDGTIVAWGAGQAGGTNTWDFSQSVVPAGLSNILAVAGGHTHSLALTSDGKVTAWGADRSVPSGLCDVGAIAAGGHSLALKTDGTMVAWGANGYGQTVVPPGLTNVLAIAVGRQHNLALQADGTVIGWGDNADGQISIPSGLSNVVAIACGRLHSVALKADGSVVAWGESRYGQLNVPRNLTNAVAIAAGNLCSAALLDDGKLVCWGSYSNMTNIPTGLAGVSQVVGGGYHNVALRGEGPPFFAAPFLSRRAFIGQTIALRVPVTGAAPISYQWRFQGADLPGRTNAVLTLTNVTAEQAGGYSVAVSNAQGVASSAEAKLVVAPILITRNPQSQSTHYGASARLSFSAASASPLRCQWRFNHDPLPGETNSTLCLSNLQASHAGAYSAMLENDLGQTETAPALLAVGPVAAWGSDVYGQTDVPPGLTNIVAVAGGIAHSLALTGDGKVVAWGTGTRNDGLNGDYGQLLLPAGLKEVAAVSAGLYHSLALRADGTVLAWGAGTRAFGSDPNYNQSIVPNDLGNVVAIAAGGYHSLALTADGRVVAWGAGTNVSGSYAYGSVHYGQSIVPTGLTGVAAIAAGGFHSLALKSDGTVVAWGAGTNQSPGIQELGQTRVPPGLVNVVAIAAGSAHSLALRSDGTVVAWGYNGNGETNVPTGLTNVVSIASGGGFSLAIQRDGRVIAWGYNYYGQTNVPAEIQKVSAIGAGYGHGLAVVSTEPPLPVVFSPRQTAGAFSLALPTRRDATYTLEFKTSLSQTDWTPVVTLPGNGNLMRLTDASTNVLQRFYRVRVH